MCVCDSLSGKVKVKAKVYTAATSGSGLGWTEWQIRYFKDCAAIKGTAGDDSLHENSSHKKIGAENRQRPHLIGSESEFRPFHPRQGTRVVA